MPSPAATLPVSLPEREPSNLELAFGDKDFQTISSIVHGYTGIVLGAHKKQMVYSRLVRRLRQLGMSSFKDYTNLLKEPEGREEIGFLINAITTNLTKFFRESHHFDHLRDVAIPHAITSNAGNRRLRMWSSACSTGEEAYSIAMIVAGRAGLLKGWDTRVLATDLDTNVLQIARQGIYADTSVDEVPGYLRKQHFIEASSGQGWQINPQLRQMIVFNKLNLMGDWPIKGHFDMIFCRNVMIYFDGPSKKRLVERLADKLCVGGWLYIGHSETLLDHHANLRLVGRTIYQKVAA